MAMDGMDMSGMSGGMDMSSDGMFKGTNMKIARLYWYIVAGVVAFLFLQRCIEWTRTRMALRSRQRQPTSIPSRPTNFLTQAYDTATATCRELAYPQLYWLKSRYLRYFNPPALGRCLVLLTYWVMILIFLWSNVILSKSSSIYAYKWEKVAFRAAWVSVTQLPLLYCLSAKTNVISIITGISYERLNWLHRWVARTMFLTVIVHWSFFFREWSLSNFVEVEIGMMPMVKWGFGSWGILGWTVLTGFGFVRSLWYELWVLQHILSALLLLWTVHTHVPSYAAYNVWLAVGFVAFDRFSRTLLLIARNLHLPSLIKQRKLPHHLIGFSACVEALSDDYTSLTVSDVDFNWRAGQHIYISLPQCGPFQSHPFTIANDMSASSSDNSSRTIKLFFKAHSGFTRNIHNHSLQSTKPSMRCFISGPYGNTPLPTIERADSLILIATSTGASFTLPILQHVANSPICARHISFYWIVRHSSQIQWLQEDILTAMNQIQNKRIEITVRVYITGASTVSENSSIRSLEPDVPAESNFTTTTDPLHRATSSVSSTSTTGSNLNEKSPVFAERSTSNNSSKPSITSPSPDSAVSTFSYRPNCLDSLVRPVVERARGETAIIACGGNGFMAEIRNYVAALSDERAVHKGTGAQGLYLFTETYGW